MKRVIMILLVAILLLTGCTQKEDVPPELPSDGFDNSGEKTVVYRGKQEFPLSFTVDGVQKIENGTYWYYEVSNAYDKSWEESFYTYDIKDLELNGSKEYTKLKDKCFATNGNWPLFLNPVHTEYTASNQNMADPALITLANQQLASNQMENVTAVVTDTWVCDMDGDGEQETIFKACNCNAEEEAERYCFIAFAGGDSCQVLSSIFQHSGPEHLTPYICDLDGDGKWTILLYQKGDYESFTAFDFTGGNFTKNYEIIF